MGFVSFQWPNICKVLGDQLAHGMSSLRVIVITNLFSQPHHFNCCGFFVFWWFLSARALHLARSHIIQLDFETRNRQGGTSWGTRYGSSTALPVCFCFSISGYVTSGWRAQKPCTGGLFLPHGCMPPFVWDTWIARILYFMSYITKVELFFSSQILWSQIFWFSTQGLQVYN